MGMPRWSATTRVREVLRQVEVEEKDKRMRRDYEFTEGEEMMKRREVPLNSPFL
jgi:hypothetical protein